MTRRPPSDEERDRTLRRRIKLESRYSRLHSDILHMAWDTRERQYLEGLDDPEPLMLDAESASRVLEYLDVADTDHVDFGDSVRPTIPYAEVHYLARVSRSTEAEHGVTAEWRVWVYDY